MENLIKSPILITGCPRSGKTMIAEILSMCGVYSGEVNNMKENVVINNLIHEYLKGINEVAEDPQQNILSIPIPGNWKEMIENVILSGDYNNEKWFYKSHLIALTWPIWNYAFSNAKYILVRRRTADVVNSCLSTGYLKHYSDREGWLNMIHKYEERFVQMISEGANVKVIWPERMVNGDYGQIFELMEWLNIPWNSSILSKIDPKFGKVRKLA